MPPYWIPEFDKQGQCSITPSGALSPHDGLTGETETLQIGKRIFNYSYIGPLGIGHEFEVGISWEEDGRRRGVCLIRSEQGLRYVARRHRGVKDALVWLTAPQQDADGDGQAELVLIEDAWVGRDVGNPAITATAYDWSGNSFRLDRRSTRKLRSYLAEVYERAAESEEAYPELRHYYAAAVAYLRSPICLLKRK